MTYSNAENHLYDKKLKCIDCEQPFIWTTKAQEAYQKRGWDTPKRCPFCQQEHKQIYIQSFMSNKNR